jgi:hypothetical protein
MNAILATLLLALLPNGPAAVDQPAPTQSTDSPGRSAQAGTQSPSNGTAEEAISKLKQGYSGLWTTTYGRMRLETVGRSVTGTYAYGNGSKVNGTIDPDGKLNFTYSEPETRGEGWFQINEDGTEFTGRWRPEGSEPWQIWTGRRIKPKKGRTWLVVLEAHWETGLSESEFAFGDMLRSYFTMADAQQLAVRHRFFHDADDLRRFCRQVTFLAEPAVVLISTHGSAKGIQVGGRTIKPKDFAPALAHAHNVKLLHLSGCDMMVGDVPSQIHELLKDGPQFPISGYKQTVAWDASALGDFTFLSLLFMHDMGPEAAVREAIKLSPYLGDTVAEGSVFQPLGLTVKPAPVSVAQVENSVPSDRQTVDASSKAGL